MKAALWLGVTAAALLGCDSGGEGAVDDRIRCSGASDAFERSDPSTATLERWCVSRESRLPHGPYERTTDGVVVASGAFDEGRAHGPWAWRDPDFAGPGTDVTGAFVRGDADGAWVATARPSGDPVWEHHFAAGEACGLWRDWVDGQLVSELQYPACDGSVPPPPFEPRWDGETCADGTALGGTLLARWCERPDGTLHGPYREDDADGLPRVEGQHIDGARAGTWVERFPGGAIAREGSYVAGAEHGVWTTRYGHGLVRETATWTDGQLHGAFEAFHPNGNRAEAGDYAAGERQGTWTAWHQAGPRAEEGSWDRGLRVGVWRQWDVHERQESEVTWEAGTQHGPATFWFDHRVVGARVRDEGLVLWGLPEGTWTQTWVAGGEPAGERAYVGGLREGPFVERYPNGNMLLEGYYVYDARFYAWRAGYESGQLYIDGTMYADELHGAYVEYWESGQKKAEGRYSYGRRHGAWSYWAEDGTPLDAHPGEAS